MFFLLLFSPAYFFGGPLTTQLQTQVLKLIKEWEFGILKTSRLCFIIMARPNFRQEFYTHPVKTPFPKDAIGLKLLIL